MTRSAVAIFALFFILSLGMILDYAIDILKTVPAVQ